MMGATKRDRWMRVEQMERFRKKEEQANALILSQYVSCSSNAKWRKVFLDLAPLYGEEQSVSVKLVGDDAFEYEHFFSQFFEHDHLDGSGGCFSYKRIEWITLPAHPDIHFDYQIDMEPVGSTIKIYGYRKAEKLS